MFLSPVNRGGQGNLWCSLVFFGVLCFLSDQKSWDTIPRVMYVYETLCVYEPTAPGAPQAPAGLPWGLQAVKSAVSFGVLCVLSVLCLLSGSRSSSRNDIPNTKETLRFHRSPLLCWIFDPNGGIQEDSVEIMQKSMKIIKIMQKDGILFK